MTNWTEPDHADEEWVQPWEEIGGTGWPRDLAGPEYWLAPGNEGWYVHDFYAPRARFVSDR